MRAEHGGPILSCHRRLWPSPARTLPSLPVEKPPDYIAHVRQVKSNGNRDTAAATLAGARPQITDGVHSEVGGTATAGQQGARPDKRHLDPRTWCRNELLSPFCDQEKSLQSRDIRVVLGLGNKRTLTQRFSPPHIPPRKRYISAEKNVDSRRSSPGIASVPRERAEAQSLGPLQCSLELALVDEPARVLELGGSCRAEIQRVGESGHRHQHADDAEPGDVELEPAPVPDLT